VPDGGIVVAAQRLRRVRVFDPLLWRGEFEAGITTATIRRLARENGLLFPPDPGAAEDSQIGGNIATNAGGPHALKYGVTGAWVTGLEAVLMTGEIITIGGLVRKDVAGYDVRSLLIGSEGTLAFVTSAWLRFIPAPEAAMSVVASYPDTASGCRAIESCIGSGIVASALEFLDRPAFALARGAFPGDFDDPGFVVIAEVDGSRSDVTSGVAALCDALGDGSEALWLPSHGQESSALWRWRDGIGLAADTALGRKVSEDIAVPVDRLGDAIEETRHIAARHGLAGCSWGHAGDGNLHATFMFGAGDAAAACNASAAADELFALAIALDGTVSAEHGLGTVKGGQLQNQWGAGAVRLHEAIKDLFDPDGLLNPGKKSATDRPRGASQLT
jgi:FAD/FMN-containing dehydrogenase